MENLPYELVYLILSSLELSSLLYTSQTCTLWRNISFSFISPITNRKELKKACIHGDILSIIKAYSLSTMEKW